MLEIHHNLMYLNGMRDCIKRAKRDLKDMERADSLPFGGKLVYHLADRISHDAVSSNIEGNLIVNYKPSELEDLMRSCKNFIETKQTLYYAFLATNVWNINLWRD